MPFNVWCLKCERHIAKGVRFNAEKKAVGSYYSTKIWSFKMRCPSCSNEIEVQTDPKITDYVVKEGARKKVETYSAEDAGVIELQDPEEKAKREADPFYKLERKEEDKVEADTKSREIAILRKISEGRKDTYSMSKLMRDRHRKERKEIAAEKAEAERRRIEEGLVVPLPHSTPEEDMEALEAFTQREVASRKAREDGMAKLTSVQSSSIFDLSSSKEKKAGVAGRGIKKAGKLTKSDLLAKARRLNVPIAGKNLKARSGF